MPFEKRRRFVRGHLATDATKCCIDAFQSKLPRLLSLSGKVKCGGVSRGEKKRNEFQRWVSCLHVKHCKVGFFQSELILENLLVVRFSFEVSALFQSKRSIHQFETEGNGNFIILFAQVLLSSNLKHNIQSLFRHSLYDAQ